MANDGASIMAIADFQTVMPPMIEASPTVGSGQCGN